MHHSEYSTTTNNVQYEQTAVAPSSDGEEHLHYVPGSGQVRCITCNTMFSSKTSAKQHIKLVHQPQEWYECCFCKKVIRGRLYFSQHIGKRHFKGGQRVVESYGKRVPPPPGEQQTLECWLRFELVRLHPVIFPEILRRSIPH